MSDEKKRKKAGKKTAGEKTAGRKSGRKTAGKKTSGRKTGKKAAGRKTAGKKTAEQTEGKKTAKRARPKGGRAETRAEKTTFERIQQAFSETLVGELAKRLSEEVLEKLTESLMEQLISRAADWIGEAIHKASLRWGAEQGEPAPAERQASEPDSSKVPLVGLAEDFIARFSDLLFGTLLKAVVRQVEEGDEEPRTPPGAG